MSARLSSIGGLVGIFALVATASTQPSRPSFEVASIKQNKSLDSGGSIGPRPGGRLVARNATLRVFVSFAYNLPSYQLAGGPDWMTADRFDVDAQADGNPPIDELRAMLRQLLEDRFRLMVHRETRQVDGFMLVRTRPDRLGTNLRASTLDCLVSFSSQPKCGEGRFTVTGETLDWTANGTRMPAVAQAISSSVGKPVSDATQLTGTFDLHLRWSPEMAQSPVLPSIYTALQEQLGLKLESQRVPIDVLVVDRAERPTPD